MPLPSEAELYPPFSEGRERCRVCGWLALLRGGRCPDCRVLFLEATWARALCDLVHRDSPARAQDLERLKGAA